MLLWIYDKVHGEQQMRHYPNWKYILILVMCIQPFLILSAVADKTSEITITSPPSAPSYSKQLGVQAAPITVVIDSVEQHGLFIYSDPNKPLGKALKLRQNVLLLTFDGFAVSSVESVDNYLARRPKNKTLIYTYIPSMSGTSSEGQVHTGKYDATPTADKTPKGK
jgi:hypothetical protein